MALTVSQTARIGTYVMSGEKLERFLKDNDIEESDKAEAEEVWADTEKAFKALKPGEQMLLPNEWS